MHSSAQNQHLSWKIPTSSNTTEIQGTSSEIVTALKQRLQILRLNSKEDERIIIAIGGVPGSGKSSISAALLQALQLDGTEDVKVVPMDGFHYSLGQLAMMEDPEGMLRRRGAPSTFDADAFVNSVQKLRDFRVSAEITDRDTVHLPSFDHAMKDPKMDISISNTVKIVIVEGNYTSFDMPPWNQIADIVTERWFLELSRDVVKKRLVERHLQSGLESWVEAAQNRAEENDLLNGDLIMNHIITPELIIRMEATEQVPRTISRERFDLDEPGTLPSNISCRLYGPGDARYDDIPQPKILDSHDVIVRISFTGVCGSDVHFWRHGGVERKVSHDAPLVMGHEASGVVHSIGSSATKVKPGDRVAIEPGFSCGRCKWCIAGSYNLCSNMRFAADPPSSNGTLCRFFLVPEKCLVKLPDNIGLDEGVLLEPLAVAVHANRLAKTRAGQSVLVTGSGTIGLLCAAVAKAFGSSKIYCLDVNRQKVEFAAKYLNCITFLSDHRSTPIQNSSTFLDCNNIPDGVDVVLECTGVESALQAGLYSAGRAAMVVQVGLGKSLQAIPITFMSEKEIVLKTAWRYSHGDFELALDLISDGRINVRDLISNVFPFEKATSAWEATAQGSRIKNLIYGPV